MVELEFLCRFTCVCFLIISHHVFNLPWSELGQFAASSGIRLPACWHGSAGFPAHSDLLPSSSSTSAPHFLPWPQNPELTAWIPGLAGGYVWNDHQKTIDVDGKSIIALLFFKGNKSCVYEHTGIPWSWGLQYTGDRLSIALPTITILSLQAILAHLAIPTSTCQPLVLSIVRVRLNIK